MIRIPKQGTLIFGNSNIGYSLWWTLRGLRVKFSVYVSS